MVSLCGEVVMEGACRGRIRIRGPGGEAERELAGLRRAPRQEWKSASEEPS